MSNIEAFRVVFEPIFYERHAGHPPYQWRVAGCFQDHANAPFHIVAHCMTEASARRIASHLHRDGYVEMD